MSDTTPNTKQELREKYDDFIKTLRVDTPDGWERKENIDFDEAYQLLSDTMNNVLDGLWSQSITVLPETYPTGQRTSIDAVPLSVIEQVRKNYQ